LHVLASAQPFGFGPVAKLAVLAGQLAPLPVTFVGSGIALRYARVNDESFVDVLEHDLADSSTARILASGCAAAISVMEPNLTYACVRARRPVHFFDSLFGFWQAERSFMELAAIADVVRRGSDAEADHAFRSLAVHEAMLVSHLIATSSYAQALPGVSDRIAMLARFGVTPIRATGSMLDVDRLRALRSDASRNSRTLLMNLGGFTNAFLDYASRGSYIDIMLRWLTGRARSSREFDEMLVCSGAFTEGYETEVNGTRMRVGMLPHRELLEVLVTRPVYLAAPGLTSLHETVALGVPVMLLPDQHYGHTHNRLTLAGTHLTRYGSSFSDLGLAIDIPDSDLDGTHALADVAAAIDRDAHLFQAFTEYMNHRLDGFQAITLSEGDDFIGELAELLDCSPIAEVMSEIRDEIRDAMAGLSS
jgi:hypothetical protein